MILDFKQPLSPLTLASQALIWANTFIEAQPWIHKGAVLKFQEYDCSSFGVCGFYRSNTCYLDFSRTGYPSTANQVRNHNFPGFRIDKTPWGVVLHELGHHIDVHWCLNHGMEVGSYQGAFAKGMAEFTPETGITNYANTNQWEWFAEAFRVWVANPELLRMIRPLTAKYFDEQLTPIECPSEAYWSEFRPPHLKVQTTWKAERKKDWKK